MSNIADYMACATSPDCDGDFMMCVEGYCRCKPTFHPDPLGNCVKCPGLGQSCQYYGCCEDQSLVCGVSGFCSCRTGIESSVVCSATTPIFITAPQIALSAALLMGMAALTMVIYRLCTKPRYLSARQRALASRTGENFDSESFTYANYLRNSLSSIQIRVLTRLRDRPPSYDNRQTTITMPEAPPPYEGRTEGMPMPPAYTEPVLSPTGYVNSSFVNTETEPANRSTDRNRSNTSPNCDTNPSPENENCDKTTEESVAEKSEAGQENRIPV